MWPWSKIKKLQDKLDRKCLVQDSLVEYLNHSTGIHHVLFNDRLLIFKPDEVLEVVWAKKY